MKTITRTLLEFDELNDEQKAQALEHHREWNTCDEQWWDAVYEDAKIIGALMGFDITRIYFSGFWSGGDGACFEGTFKYPGKAILKAVKRHAPINEELHQVAKAAAELYAASFYTARGTVMHRGGRNYNENCMTLDLADGDMLGRCDYAEWHELLRMFAQWIYSSLQAEYLYLTGDEAVTESIQSNGIEFEIDDDGSIKF